MLSFLFSQDYFRRLLRIAIPIAFQQLILASLNMVSVLMVGQLGETAVAAVALANQVFFLLQLVLFGISSGSAIFTAQLWGKQDVPNIRRVLGLCLTLGFITSLVFLAISQFLPDAALSVYSKDPTVIELGSAYLRLFGWAFLFFAVTQCFSMVLRSIGQIKIPLAVTLSALSFNAMFSYALIFGKFGLPEMGVKGAAIAGLCARVLECCALVWITYRSRSPAAGKIKELLSFNVSFAGKVLRPVLTVAFNELLWSLGITTYNAIYARISTDAIAAMNIASSIDTMAFTVTSGICNATAILVGHWIGAGNEDEAQRYGGRSLVLAALLGLVMGGVILLVSPGVLTLYKVSPDVIQDAQRVMAIIAGFLWLRWMNTVLLIGIMRSGGDTHYAFFLDGIIIWIVGVPLTALAAFSFHLPVYWVYLFVMSEEVCKWVLGLIRYFSKKWIHDMAQGVG